MDVSKSSAPGILRPEFKDRRGQKRLHELSRSQNMKERYRT